MIRSRGPFSGGPSKASPQTLCQKCLKKGHYSYECKATTQERPYASRPSRTQQLNNPKLAPKLLSDIPNGLLQKKGIADKQLAKREEERGRQRAIDDNHQPPNSSRKRSRSVSSYSSTSVSTISTNLSRSISPKRPKLGEARPSFGSESLKRRRSSSISEASYSSDDSYKRRGKLWAKQDDRNTRRRRSSVSPDNRGRDSITPERRRPPRSRSNSMDRDGIARHRHSLTPDRRSVGNRSNGRPHERSRRAAESGRYGDTRHPPQGHDRRSALPVPKPHAPLPRKERSLSPFSKRLALTQAMNMGR